MVSRLTVASVAVLVLVTAHAAARSQQNPYRLKQPDQKQLCLDCHTDFRETLGKRFVHSPVRAGQCSGCHDPHVSSHGKLLSDDPREICLRCHEGIVPAHARSRHQAAADGECQKCHDPHASNHRGHLVAGGNDLCFTCHQEMAKAVRGAKFKHRPVEQGCVSCHQPHGSAATDRLLTTAVPGQCVSCHKPDAPAFVARHQKYPVGRSDCASCHDPHGSSRPAMLLSTVHAPIAAGSCSQCHEGPGSATPFATKRPGFELCRGCHAEMVSATMGSRRLHWPVADRQGCANCHNPHASRQAGLLASPTPALCGKCHRDTLTRLAVTAVKHEPVQGGACTVCHSPHGAQAPNLVDHASIMTLCTTCHDYERHSAHPIGESAIDPRNRNLRIDCLSCHGGHGTDFKWMLLSATNLELCTQCHKKFTR
jgi:predicted CXXCH cytochrome family protein